jgi:hypothetical protein
VDKDGFLQSVFEATKIQRDSDGSVFYLEGEEKKPLQEDELVSMNFWGFHPSFFEAANERFRAFVKANVNQPRAEFYIPTVVNDQLDKKEIKLSVLPNEERWYGVTYQDDKAVVVEAFQKMIDEDVYPNSLW